MYPLGAKVLTQVMDGVELSSRFLAQPPPCIVSPGIQDQFHLYGSKKSPVQDPFSKVLNHTLSYALMSRRFLCLEIAKSPRQISPIYHKPVSSNKRCRLGTITSWMLTGCNPAPLAGWGVPLERKMDEYSNDRTQ